MANVFRQFSDYVEKPKRNTFDLTLRNHLTTKFGQLTPVFCREVVPGDSFRIDSTFGFRMMPLAFPVQTPMRANLHFFYVRNRNLWKDWPDFIGKTKANLIPPYIAPENVNVIKTCSLYDYLGLPTVAYNTGSSDSDIITAYSDSNPLVGCAFFKDSRGTAIDFTNPLLLDWRGVGAYVNPYNDTVTSCEGLVFFSSEVFNINRINSLVIATTKVVVLSRFLYIQRPDTKVLVPLDNRSTIALKDGKSVITFNDNWADDIIQGLLPNDRLYFAIVIAQDAQNTSFAEGKPTYFHELSYVYQMQDVSDLDLVYNPYRLSQGNNNRISALPFRAYESIYNSFYRNNQVDPFKAKNDQGLYVAEYNKFIESDEGGPDSYDYEMRYRPWEHDQFTSAVQSPQQGIAPLVGVNSSGTFTFQDAEGNLMNMKVTIGDDGETLKGIETMDAGLKGSGTARAMVDMISNGISINDFRNVNSLQRWLETNIRRGLRYKEQILSHFGVETDYSILDMPEFIGGVSRPVNINTVVQTSPYGDTELGEYAGQGTVFGQSESVSKYCDEHGFIIGILSFVPVPCYSQAIPKHFLKTDVLDYYFPEFGHLGLQPILNREVSFINSYVQEKQGSAPAGSGYLDEFGYQRAWYDYISAFDEVHGLFRTSLKNFILTRDFSITPKLGHDFISIKPEDLTNIFVNNDDTDKILGVIEFKVSAKRPIPMVGIPRLE